MRQITLFSAMAMVFTASAGADFIGWQVERVTLGNGHNVMNVYATFNNAGDRVVNVYDTDISCNSDGGFFQSAANPFWRPGTEHMIISDDSWVTIDTNPNGNGNASGTITSGDPNFFNFDDLNEATDFSVIESVGNGAGWYNAHPETLWGFADGPGNRVLVAHLVISDLDIQITDNVLWNAKMTITLNGQTGSTSGVGAGENEFNWFIPGPGALALLGVVGLTGRRSRR